MLSAATVLLVRSSAGLVVDVVGKPLLSGLRIAAVEAGAWEDLEACPLCRRAEHLHDVSTVVAESLGSVTSVCVACRYGFMRRRPTTEWFDAFYAGDWDERGRAAAGRGELAARPNSKVLEFSGPHLPRRARVLDIGAGFGSLLLPFRERGHDVQGIERSEHRAGYLRETLGIPCVSGAIESAAVQGEFDLVFSHHVLEHVADPAKVILRARGLLGDGGLLYVAVPNIWFEYPPQAFHFVPHLSLFTLEALTGLLARNGFEIIRSTADRELQVVARKGASAGQVRREETGSAEFEQAVSRWAVAAFGQGEGERTLVWFKSRSRAANYRTQLLRGRLRPGLLNAAHAVWKASPRPALRAWRGVSPEAVSSGSLRLLTVRLSGEARLPVTVRHPGRSAPIWIK